MAHEVYQKEDGTLGVRIPETVWNAFDKEEKKDDFVIDTPTKSSEVVVGRNTGGTFSNSKQMWNFLKAQEHLA